MSVEGDNQYPVASAPVMGYEVKGAATKTPPPVIPATLAVRHAQTEVDRAVIGLIQLDGVDFCGKLIMAMITPSDQLRRDHLLASIQPLERATSRLREMLAKLDERLTEASKK